MLWNTHANADDVQLAIPSLPPMQSQSPLHCEGQLCLSALFMCSPWNLFADRTWWRPHKWVRHTALMMHKENPWHTVQSHIIFAGRVPLWIKSLCSSRFVAGLFAKNKLILANKKMNADDQPNNIILRCSCSHTNTLSCQCMPGTPE